MTRYRAVIVPFPSRRPSRREAGADISGHDVRRLVSGVAARVSPGASSRVRLAPLLSIALLGCDGCDESVPGAPAPSASSTAVASAEPSRGGLYVARADGGGGFRLELRGDRAVVSAGGEVLTGTLAGGTWRFTIGEAPAVVAKVERGGGAFRVKNAEARPVWSVRLGPRAIWIEGAGGPLVVRTLDARLEVLVRGEPVGSVTLDGGALVAERGARSLTAETDALSAVFAVALLDEIQKIERHAIMVEIGAQGR